MYNLTIFSIILLFVLLIFYYYLIKRYDNFTNINYKNLNFDILNKCQVPTLNSYSCYLSKFYECPVKNGSYLQCTNNYLPKPTNGNCDCSNRTFDMCPYPFKLSNNCYYHNNNFRRKIFKK